ERGEMFLALLQRHHRAVGSCFETRDVALQRTHLLLVLGGLGLRGSGLVGSIGGSGLRLLEVLLSLLPVLLILLQLLSKLLDLLLLRRQRIFQRLNVGRRYRRLRGCLCRNRVLVCLFRSGRVRGLCPNASR